MASDLLYELESAIAYVSVSGTVSEKLWQIQYVLVSEMAFRLVFEIPLMIAFEIRYGSESETVFDSESLFQFVMAYE